MTDNVYGCINTVVAAYSQLEKENILLKVKIEALNRLVDELNRENLRLSLKKDEEELPPIEEYEETVSLSPIEDEEEDEEPKPKVTMAPKSNAGRPEEWLEHFRAVIKDGVCLCGVKKAKCRKAFSEDKLANFKKHVVHKTHIEWCQSKGIQIP